MARKCERCLKEVPVRRARWGDKIAWLCEPCIKSLKRYNGKAGVESRLDRGEYDFEGGEEP